MARLKRILRHPAAAVVLLVMLGVSVWLRPSGMNQGLSELLNAGQKPQLKRTTPDLRPRHGWYFHARVAYLLRESGGFRVIDENAHSWDELSKLAVDRPGDVIQCELVYRRGLEGLFAPTKRVSVVYLELTGWSYSKSFSHQELAEARRVFVETARAEGWISDVELADSAWAVAGERPVGHIETLWSGYLQNVATAAALVLAPYAVNFGLVPCLWGLPATLRARRRHTRLSRGLCPRCRYPLHGLAGNKCPECGEQWGSAEEQAARA